MNDFPIAHVVVLANSCINWVMPPEGIPHAIMRIAGAEHRGPTITFSGETP